MAFKCPFPGCNYKTRKLGWLSCHYQAKHGGRLPREDVVEEPSDEPAEDFKCPMEGCNFTSTEEGSIRKHCKMKHGIGYEELLYEALLERIGTKQRKEKEETEAGLNDSITVSFHCSKCNEIKIILEMSSCQSK